VAVDGGLARGFWGREVEGEGWLAGGFVWRVLDCVGGGWVGQWGRGWDKDRGGGKAGRGEDELAFWLWWMGCLEWVFLMVGGMTDGGLEMEWIL